MTLVGQREYINKVLCLYFEMGNCSYTDLAITPIPFMEAILIQRGKMQEEAVGDRPSSSRKHQDNYATTAPPGSPGRQSGNVKESATISFDTLMDNQSMTKDLTGMIARYSQPSPGGK